MARHLTTEHRENISEGLRAFYAGLGNTPDVEPRSRRGAATASTPAGLSGFHAPAVQPARRTSALDRTNASPQRLNWAAQSVSGYLENEAGPFRGGVRRREQPINAADYDLTAIAADIVDSNLDLRARKMTGIHAPYTGDRQADYNKLHEIMERHRLAQPSPPARPPYSGTTMETASPDEVFSVAISLQRANERENRGNGTYTIPGRQGIDHDLAINAILASGLDTSSLLDENLDPDTREELRARVRDVVQAADDARIKHHRETTRASFEANRASTGVPFKGYETTYRADNIDGLSENKALDMTDRIAEWVDYPEINGLGRASLADFDIPAVQNEIISLRLNVNLIDSDSDEDEYGEVGNGLTEILNRHRTSNARPLTPEVNVAGRDPKTLTRAEQVQAYADVRAAVLATGVELNMIDAGDLRKLTKQITSSGLNVRLLSDPRGNSLIAGRSAVSVELERLLDALGD